MPRQFNGTIDYVDCGTNTALVPSTNKITFSAWINPDTSGLNSYNAIVERAKNDVSVIGDYQFLIKSNYKLALYVHQTAGVTSYDGTGAVTVASGKWSHVMFTANLAAVTSFSTYVNGVNDGNLNGSTTWGQTETLPFRIGNESTGSRGFLFKGAMADVAVWNDGPFGINEILQLVNGARPCEIRRTALVGWWPLDGLQSPEPDFSGNQFAGTLTGTSRAIGGPPLDMLTRKIR